MTAQGPPIINALTIDVEEYFHPNAMDGVLQPEQWDLLPHRVERNALLDDGLIVDVQRDAAAVEDARALEAAGLDRERVVFAVGAFPTADRSAHPGQRQESFEDGRAGRIGRSRAP